jgi:hypothetical protein
MISRILILKKTHHLFDLIGNSAANVTFCVTGRFATHPVGWANSSIAALRRL